MAKFCTNCGTKLPPDARFCEVCGTPVETGAPQPDQQPKMQSPGQVQYRTGSDHYRNQDQYQNQNKYQNQYQNQNQYQDQYRQNPGYPPGPGGYPPSGPPYGKPPKQGGKGPVIIGAVVFLGIAVILFLRGGLGKKGDDKETKPVSETRVSGTKEAGSPSEGGLESLLPGSGASGNTAVNGGPSASGLSGVQIPAGASVVTDASFYQLVNEWKGEILLTEMDGFEQIDGIPSNFSDIKKEALSAPIPCTLEIEEDGDWSLDIDLMSGMRMRGRDFRIEEPKSQEEAEAHLIRSVSDGTFVVDLHMEDEKEDAAGSIMNRGTLCEDGEGKLIAGRFEVTFDLAGKLVSFAGNYTVRPENEVMQPPEGSTGAFTESSAAESESIAVESGNSPAESESSVSGSSSGTGTGSIFGKITQELESAPGGPGGIPQGLETPPGEPGGTPQGHEPTPEGPVVSGNYTPENYSIIGGHWDVLQSGEWVYYMPDGSEAVNTWVDNQDGYYYYIGFDGCMVKNNYSADGYWLDTEGKWDRSVPKRLDDAAPLENREYGTSPTLVFTGAGAGGGQNNLIMTRSYSFGYSEQFSLTPQGHGAYMMTALNDPSIKGLLVVAANRKSVTLTEAGITERYQLIE